MTTEPMDQDEEISRYLAGEMSSDELQLFKAKLKNDPTLQEEVAHFRSISSIVDQEVVDFSAEVRNVIVTNRRASSAWWWVAAAIPLLALSFYFLSQKTSSSQKDQLASYFEPYPDVISTRASEGSLVDMSDYNEGNFAEAIQSLNQAYKGESRLIGLYLAISYVYSDQPKKGLEILNIPIQASHPLSNEYAWYKSYALIKSGRLEEARSLLRTIAKGESVYAEKAQRLLTKLSEL